MPKLDHKKPVPVERRIFSTNLRAARHYAGLTLHQVVDITTITASFISNVENGNHNVSILSMAQLSQAVQVPLYALLNPSYKPESFNRSEWETYAQLIQAARPEVLELQLLAEKPRYYRKLANLTQAQVDQFAGFRDKTTSDIERHTGNMSLDVIAPLAPVLGIPFYKLFSPNS